MRLKDNGIDIRYFMEIAIFLFILVGIRSCQVQKAAETCEIICHSRGVSFNGTKDELWAVKCSCGRDSTLAPKDLP